TCPAPITVTTEGINQTVSGTATDRAGNSASASVILNIDKTAPRIAAVATPAPNASGWNRSPVTVDFACQGQLSGVVSCPTSLMVDHDGRGQVVSGMTTDAAGNTASASLSLDIDATPPVVAIASPTNDTTTHSAAVNVAGSIGDLLSGIDSVT